MMRSVRALGLSLCGALLCVATAHAQVTVERHSHENPMVEIYRSTAYGALAGAVVGGAIALSTDDSADDWNAVRWGTVAGTFVGLATGFYFAASRPQPHALLDLSGGDFTVHALPTVDAGLGGSVRVHLLGVGF